MIKRIAQTAGFSGLLAALLLTLLQSLWVSPLILQAETYEKAPAAEAPVEVHQHADGVAHTHDAEAWEPKMAGSACCPPPAAIWWSRWVSP